MSSSLCPIGTFYTTPNSLFTNPKPHLLRTKPLLFTNATKSSTTSNNAQDHESMSIDALKKFIRLNLGTWTGSFHVSIYFFT